MRTATAIRFDDLTLGYGRRPAVHHLDGEVAAGSLTAVVGTLRPLAGHIGLSGGPKTRIAYLPQAADLDRSFPLPVYDLVAMGLWSRSGLFGGVGARERARVAEAMAAVGLTGFERRPISTLSGGQMQRALFARLLLQDASVILLDEPFTAIDAKTTADLLDLVRRWHEEARTVIAVLHDLEVVRRVFPRTLLIAREPVAWGETAEVLKADNLLRARRMVEAHDPHAHACAA